MCSKDTLFVAWLFSVITSVWYGNDCHTQWLVVEDVTSIYFYDRIVESELHVRHSQYTCGQWSVLGKVSCFELWQQKLSSEISGSHGNEYPNIYSVMTTNWLEGLSTSSDPKYIPQSCQKTTQNWTEWSWVVIILSAVGEWQRGEGAACPLTYIIKTTISTLTQNLLLCVLPRSNAKCRWDAAMAADFLFIAHKRKTDLCVLNFFSKMHFFVFFLGAI